jgi:hypothetical protein
MLDSEGAGDPPSFSATAATGIVRSLLGFATGGPPLPHAKTPTIPNEAHGRRSEGRFTAADGRSAFVRPQAGLTLLRAGQRFFEFRRQAKSQRHNPRPQSRFVTPERYHAFGGSRFALGFVRL